MGRVWGLGRFRVLEGQGSIILPIFWTVVPSGGNPVERLAILIYIECGFACCCFRVAPMNELGNVVARGQANMNGVFRPGAPIIIFEPLPSSTTNHPADCIHLRFKRYRAPP